MQPVKTHLRLLMICLLCTSAFHLAAQFEKNANIDERSLPPGPFTPNYVDSLIWKAKTNYNAHPELTKLFSDRALVIADSLHYEKGLADAYMVAALTFKMSGDYPNELALHLKALAIYQSHNDSLSIAKAYNAIGVVHYQMNDFSGANEFLDKALSLYTALRNTAGIAETYLKKGNVYLDQKDYPRGIAAYEKALHAQEALHNDGGIANALNNLGITYYELKQYDKALSYLKRSFELLTKLNNLNRLPASYHNIARVYLDQGKLKDAEILAEKSLQLSLQQGLKPAKAEALKLYSDIYKREKKNDLALSYLEQYHGVMDSIISSENTQHFARMQAIYKLEEKEKAIALLQKDNAYSSLLNKATIAGFFGLLIIAGLIIYDQRNRSKRNEESAAKNLVIQQTQTALKEVELENKKLIEKELRQDLEFRHKELLIFTLNLVQKNTLMEEMRGGIQEVLTSTDKDSKIKLNRLIKLIDYSLETEKDWDEFKMYFEKVHSSFFDNLKAAYPELTQSDLKLCALTSLNLSMKDTAELLGISPESVKMARHRLRKKLNLETESNLTDFLNNFKEVES